MATRRSDVDTFAMCCTAGVLAQNDRLGELPAIANTFDDIMAAVRGEVKATVTTAEVNVRQQ